MGCVRIAIFFGTAAAIWAALYFVLEVAFCIALAWALQSCSSSFSGCGSRFSTRATRTHSRDAVAAAVGNNRVRVAADRGFDDHDRRARAYPMKSLIYFHLVAIVLAAISPVVAAPRTRGKTGRRRGMGGAAGAVDRRRRDPADRLAGQTHRTVGHRHRGGPGGRSRRGRDPERHQGLRTPRRAGAAHLGRCRRGGPAAVPHPGAPRDVGLHEPPVGQVRRPGRRGGFPGGLPRRPCHHHLVLHGAAARSIST